MDTDRHGGVPASVGGYTLATHRIGATPLTKMFQTSFRVNKTAAPKMAQWNKRQLALPFPTDDVEVYDDSDQTH